MKTHRKVKHKVKRLKRLKRSKRSKRSKRWKHSRRAWRKKQKRGGAGKLMKEAAASVEAYLGYIQGYPATFFKLGRRPAPLTRDHSSCGDITPVISCIPDTEGLNRARAELLSRCLTFFAASQAERYEHYPGYEIVGEGQAAIDGIIALTVGSTTLAIKIQAEWSALPIVENEVSLQMKAYNGDELSGSVRVFDYFIDECGPRSVIIMEYLPDTYRLMTEYKSESAEAPGLVDDIENFRIKAELELIQKKIEIPDLRTNLMIKVVDGQPQGYKILDFGMAKSIP